ncbi:hypothetical protein EDB85DRAFT_2005753 [Lactarius pseudohatsudake]|nr:hypothetical protein EDB85DRAFT_2005753 [Lactarius pseudohatsudake]
MRTIFSENLALLTTGLLARVPRNLAFIVVLRAPATPRDVSVGVRVASGLAGRAAILTRSCVPVRMCINATRAGTSSVGSVLVVSALAKTLWGECISPLSTSVWTATRTRHMCKRLTFPVVPLALAALANRVVKLSSSASVVIVHAASLLTGRPARLHVVMSVIYSKGAGGLKDADCTILQLGGVTGFGMKKKTW